MLFKHVFGQAVDKDWLARGAVESFWKAHAREAGGKKGKEEKKVRATTGKRRT
jgi:hypothetical protein